jgi:hypothetical protein
MRPLVLTAVLALAGTAGAAGPDILRATSALPAHVAGRFSDIARCQAAENGDLFVLDRRAHAVFRITPGGEVRELVQIGNEAGRVLRPYAFDLGGDGSFVVADAPGNQGRIQIFLTSGAAVGRFLLDARSTPSILSDEVVVSGLGALEYDGRHLYVNQPEMGALVTEYDLDGRIARTFGTLRPTGHESDPPLHLALNAALPVLDPQGGMYVVFLAGTPLFRKYDRDGRMMFERHIEGPELDGYIQSLPTTWPKRRIEDRDELPVVPPAVRAAAADRAGRLWISLAAGVTYVYDAEGEKTRTVQFRGAGVLVPHALAFAPGGRLLAAPGCYAFDPDADANRGSPAKNVAAAGSTR